MSPNDTLISTKSFRNSAGKKEVEQIPQASEKNPLTTIKAF